MYDGKRGGEAFRGGESGFWGLGRGFWGFLGVRAALVLFEDSAYVKLKVMEEVLLFGASVLGLRISDYLRDRASVAVPEILLGGGRLSIKTRPTLMPT